MLKRFAVPLPRKQVQTSVSLVYVAFEKRTASTLYIKQEETAKENMEFLLYKKLFVGTFFIKSR